NTQILEFNPAVTAYQSVATDGFRTFVKIDNQVHELFGENDLDKKRYMKIKRSEFSVIEENYSLGLKIEVVYFGLPNENIAALIRQVKITNLADHPQHIELFDGLSQLFPYQVSNSGFNSVGNLLRSWMEVFALEHNIGYYRMRSSSSDTAEVVETNMGNFYLSSFNGSLVKPIVDSRLIFDYDTSKRFARYFEKHSIKEIYSTEQVTANKVPIGFTGIEVDLKSKQEIRIDTVIGTIHSQEYLLEIASKLIDTKFLDQKREEAFVEIETMLEEVSAKTSFPIFDDYIKQNYLDNILRGGYPLILKGENQNFVYHLFSRRHGDLERDYNFFSLAPEFYSQGNGSFRDVCQNRRNDVLLNPKAEDFNMKMFASFIQADGYNPLSINGSTFEIEDKDYAKKLVKELFPNNPEMCSLLCGKFTPGSIVNTMANKKIAVELNDDELFDKIFRYAKQNFEANFAEGYWIDHWTYILDLVENYAAVYPDHMKEKLYQDYEYMYFDSPIYVLPRSEKICVTKDGKVRRYGSILHDDNEKIAKLNMNPFVSNWLRNDDNEILKTNLFAKLFVLATTKIANLDPYGIGIEMEADKPGWNDAMNGLPGLFGSGFSEVVELKRVVKFLLNNFDKNAKVLVPKELIKFVSSLIELFKQNVSDFDYWDCANEYKELYRKEIRFYSKGNVEIPMKTLFEALTLYNSKIDNAIEKAYEVGNGIFPTYLIYEVTKYEKIIENGKNKIGNYGLETAKALEFSMRLLPFYLEAPARALKIMKDPIDKRNMFNRIKASNIYDYDLKFYKTSEFLDQESNEIGRGRSFTKGWQERESNFLHMTYKYLLGMLKGGLYQEFFQEIKTNLTCFMDPAVYGRSTLENSSFIASSINPDPFVRGQGFVARLSGSTAEMLSIWLLMMFGKTPFVFDEELVLDFKPIISKEFFLEGAVSCMFLGKTTVTYHNEKMIDTFAPEFKIQKYIVDGIEYHELRGEIAHQVRDGLVSQIEVYF
ncbi:MAG: cellobiose phosphorylase, partial [Firmicutes bacterium]|nr:cellobiose phosphorylase [Bacillota bacterium]